MFKLKPKRIAIPIVIAVALAWVVLPGRGAAPAPTGATRVTAGDFQASAQDPQGAWCSRSDNEELAWGPRTWQVIKDLGAPGLGAQSAAAAQLRQADDDDDSLPVEADANAGTDALDVTTVTAAVETGSVQSDADDPAIWIHPTDPAQSLVIGTDKSNGLFSWDLAGTQVQYIGSGQPNNVDVRYGFPLGGQSVDLVGTGNESGNKLQFYRVDPQTRQMVDVSGPGIPIGINETYGFCMYRSPADSAFYAFINDKDGNVEQWRLNGAGGTVTGQRVRTFSVGSQTEGCVADDETGDLFIGEENVGFWKYGAEPTAGSARTKIDGVGGAGPLRADVEGIAIYYGPGGSGYLLVSSQGNSTFAVYDRQAPHAFITSFGIGAGNGIDSVGSTDGIDVTNAALGGPFAEGLFVAHDGSNNGGANNYKLVRWSDIAAGSSPTLAVDTSYDPRGGTGSPPPPGATSPPKTATPGAGGIAPPPMALSLGQTAQVQCTGGRLTYIPLSDGQGVLKCDLPGPPDPGATPTTPAGAPTATRTAAPAPTLGIGAPTATPAGGLQPQDPPGRQVPDETFNSRRLPIELQAWWAPNFGHIHAAAMLPLGQDVSGTLNFDVRIVLHDNPSHLFELRIDTDQGVFKRIPLNERCPYDGKTSTNCAFNVPVSLDTTKMTNGWREIRIRATVETVDGKRFLNSSGVPLHIVNGGGGSDYDRWCGNRSLIGRGWYDGFGYTNAVIECVPTAPVSGVHTFNVRAQQTSNHIQVALDKSHYIPAVGSWPEVAPSTGRILVDKSGNFQSFFPVVVDTRQLANGWHSLAVTSTGDGGTSNCAFCSGEQNDPAGVAKIWFFVQN